MKELDKMKLDIQQLVFMCFYGNEDEAWCSDHADKLAKEMFDMIESHTKEKCAKAVLQCTNWNEANGDSEEVLIYADEAREACLKAQD